MTDEITFMHKPFEEKGEQGKEAAALPIATKTEAGKGPFIFAPTETPEEYQSLYEKIAALDQVNKLYVPRAKTSSKFYLDKYISALGSRTEFQQNFFDEFEDATWKEYMVARNKLLGRTPLSAWAWDESPLSTLYLIGKGFYDGIKKGKDIDGFISKLRDDNEKKRKDIDKRYGGDGKKPSAGGGSAEWDAEKYWDFVGRIKANMADKWRRTLDKIYNCKDEKEKNGMIEHYKDGVKKDIGLLYTVVVPFAGNIPKEVMDDTIKKYTDLDYNNLDKYVDRKHAGNYRQQAYITNPYKPNKKTRTNGGNSGKSLLVSSYQIGLN